MNQAPAPKIINEEAELVLMSSVRPHPENPREGDIGDIFESIKENGFWGHIVCQRSTGFILIGNHRYLAAMQIGMKKIPVVWVEVDDDRARRIMLRDNRSSDKASYNLQRLVETLTDLETTTELKLGATGFEPEDLNDLINDLTRAATRRDPDEEKPKKQKGEEKLAIVLVCENEDQQAEMFEEITSLGYSPAKANLNARTKLTI